MLAAGALQAQMLKIVSPEKNSVSLMTRQAVIVSGRPNTNVVLYANGAAVDSAAIRPDGVADFLNIPVLQGPVLFVVKSNNGVGESDSVKIHIAGEPTNIIIEPLNDNFVADGRSTAKFRVIATDKFGVVIPSTYFISLSVDSTVTLIADDNDPNQAGVQKSINNGVVEFEVKAPAQSTVATVKAAWGKVYAEQHIEFATPNVPLMIVGSADASATRLSTSGDLSQLKNKNNLDAGFHNSGRLAFYGRGTVWNKYLLTASFDNERRQRDRLFQDLDPDVLYSIYGDNSRVDYTAQTSNPFFVKLERNRSYMMFGDFNTGLHQNELARYDRTFTGVSGHYETRSEKLDAFATLTDRKVVQDEIRGQGISGFYFLGSSNVVPGSEKVRIEVRDKRHNEIILSRIDKARFGDYEIDYTQGTLFFKQPIASIDQSGNPTYIVVSYESQGGFAESYVAGGQAEKEIAKGLTLGATAVTEERKPTNYTLYGANARYQYTNRFNASAEFAHGADLENAGSAWKIEAGGSPVERMQLKSYFRKVENGFVNQTAGAGGTGEIGSTKYGVGGIYDGLFETKLAADYYRSEQSSGNANVIVNSLSGGIERKLFDFASLSLRAENLAYESRRTDTSVTNNRQSTLVNGKMTVRATERLNITGEYEHSFSETKNQEAKPSSGAVGLEYRVLDNVTVSAQQRFYLNNGSTSVFGIGSNVGYGTTVTGRYEIGNGINGRRNQASIGLKNTTKLTDDLTSNIQFERTRALDRNFVEAQTNDNDALSLGFEYLPKKTYKATIKGEIGKTAQSFRRNLTFGGDIRIANDFTLIDKFTYYEEDRNQPQVVNNTFSDGTLSLNQIGVGIGSGLMKRMDNAIGLAYRPIDVDWLNAIGKYQKKMEFNGLVSPQTSSNVDIISLHTFIEPFGGMEIGTKYAMKYATEEAYGLTASTITDFYLVRAEYNLRWNGFDVAAEYRILNSRIVNQANSNSIKNGYSAEVGYVAFENIHVGVGYNFVGTEDKDLVSKDYWSAGPFVSFRMKFTEKILNMFNK